MLLRGRQVELIRTDGSHFIDRGDGFWILSFTHGEILSPCEVMVCRCKPAPNGMRYVHPDDLAEARSYYERTRFRAYEPQFSVGGWRYVALISTIWYLRDRPPPYRHVFDEPVRCYQSDASPTTFKLSLPRGCILNDHGFVEPLAPLFPSRKQNDGHSEETAEGSGACGGLLQRQGKGR